MLGTFPSACTCRCLGCWRAGSCSPLSASGSSSSPRRTMPRSGFYFVLLSALSKHDPHFCHRYHILKRLALHREYHEIKAIFLSIINHFSWIFRAFLLFYSVWSIIIERSHHLLAICFLTSIFIIHFLKQLALNFQEWIDVINLIYFNVEEGCWHEWIDVINLIYFMLKKDADMSE